MELKIISNKGKNMLMKLLAKIKNNGDIDFDNDMLLEESIDAYNIINERIIINRNKMFNSRYELGKYLCELLDSVDRNLLFSKPGIWNWLTLLWLDQLCPTYEKGRKVGETARYIYDSKYNKYYRHLVLSSWDIYSLHNNFSKLMLYSPVYQINDILEQFASRQNIITNQGLIEAAYKLYWDDEQNRPKVGASDRKRPGNIRRLVIITEQLELTYDLHVMSADDIISLLPKEFNEWMN